MPNFEAESQRGAAPNKKVFIWRVDLIGSNGKTMRTHAAYVDDDSHKNLIRTSVADALSVPIEDEETGFADANVSFVGVDDEGNRQRTEPFKLPVTRANDRRMDIYNGHVTRVDVALCAKHEIPKNGAKIEWGSGRQSVIIKFREAVIPCS